ncbi:MAG: molybdopterin converting factor subunit 1 [Pseudomonadota bacterium]
MEVAVLFFARVREDLDCDRLQLALAEDGQTVGKVRERLMLRGPTWERVLSETNLVAACNHEVVDDSHRLSAGDEIAFYPPVTGG